MKKQRKIEKDNRGVAIYARKSRITNIVLLINAATIIPSNTTAMCLEI